ncbi:twin-arginine translocase subunit TatC [Marispirochaeta aestuarii]|uniref:twin-arginine translocase subunit TatC n=1 Tax=Marispirochaeta aestuarii TaxID=1963862 RepID=UPI0029C94603|nr:twin-arginine translocase subunit TatC [Marispirochaeta aestuarii]
MPDEKEKLSREEEQLLQLSVRQHLRELRSVILISAAALALFSVVSFYFFDPIVNFLYAPFLAIEGLNTEDTLFVNFLFEGFLTKLKVSILSGFTLSIPVMLFMIVRFVLPALRRKEKRVLFLAIFTGTLLVGVGFYYGYYTILPLTIKFFTNRGFLPENVGLMLNYQRNILYIFRFILIIMVSFQFPILLEALMILNVLERKTLFKASRFVIVLVFILAAFITPPDFISQCIIAAPLILLYFLAIFVAKIFRFGEGER